MGLEGAREAWRDWLKSERRLAGHTLVAYEHDVAAFLGFMTTYLGSTPTEKQPRGFNIDPTGRFIVVSGEQSDTIASYAIDAETGAPKPIGRYPTGKGANWVEIVAFD